MEGALRPRRRLTAGDGDAQGEGRRTARLQRRRVPLGRLLPSDHAAIRPAQHVHRGQAPALARAEVGRARRPDGAVWQFAADAPARPAAERWHDRGRLPAEHDQVRVRPVHEHLLPRRHGRGEAGRRGGRGARPSEERRGDDHEVRTAQRRPSEQAPPGGRGHRSAARPTSRPTATRSSARGARSH